MRRGRWGREGGGSEGSGVTLRAGVTWLARRSITGLALATALAGPLSPTLQAESSQPAQYQIQAEFVERFTRFIDWPSDAFPDRDAPFVVCVVGKTPVTAYLERRVRDRQIKGRRAELRQLAPTADLSSCNLVFIAAEERPHLDQILTGLEGRPVATVADSAGFAQKGVLINLVHDSRGGRVRFEICSDAAKRTALRLHAQLLYVARPVEEAGR